MIAEDIAGRLYFSDSNRAAIRAAFMSLQPSARHARVLRTKRHSFYRRVLAAHATNQRLHRFGSGGMYPDLDPGQ